MNILQNLFQHSKALLHLKPLNFLSFHPEINRYRAEENLSSLFERRKDGFNQAPFSEALISEFNTQALQRILVGPLSRTISSTSRIFKILRKSSGTSSFQ